MTNVPIRAGSTFIVALLLLLLAPALPATAHQLTQPGSVSASVRYQVTFVARACSGYSSVMVNRVRDDRIEAAALPGRVNAYQDGQAVDPDIEAANGNGCTPLTGWHFSLGNAPEKKGALSSVTTPAVDSGATAVQVPRLDSAGVPTGRTMDGAVTLTLTDDQVRLAARRQLWAQGGTPGDPLLAQSTPGYGFGVLRCAVDGRSGTDVQWIGFGAGARHVFCYAYYVKNAAPPATLMIRARTSRNVGYAQQFGFDASPSYTASKRVALNGDLSFVRSSGGAAGTVVSRTPDGWRLADLSCTKSGAGTSTATTDASTGTVTVTLAAGEVVTCTYIFEPPPSPPGLTLRLFGESAGGAFGLTVDGDGGPRALQAAPSGDGSPVTATGADLTALLPGAYTVTLAVPVGESALWTFAGVNCGGTELKPVGQVVTVLMTTTAPTDCTLRVTRKGGTLDLRAITVGGIGTASFVVVPRAEGAVGWSSVATTTMAGTAAGGGGDVPAPLPFGEYLVTPLPPPSTVDGSWRLSSFSCDPGDSSELPDVGVDVVPLATAAPAAACTANFLFQASTKLQVTLRFAGSTSGRNGDVVIDVSCADGSTGRAVLAAEDTGESSLPAPLGFLEPTNCTVARPVTPAVDSATVSLAADLEPTPGNAPMALPGSVDLVRDVPLYTVTVTVTFHNDEPAPTQARVLDTFRVLPVALIGAGLVGIGLVILLVMVVRSRAV